MIVAFTKCKLRIMYNLDAQRAGVVHLMKLGDAIAEGRAFSYYSPR